MAGAGEDGGFNMTFTDMMKYGIILIAMGGAVARYEMRQSDLDRRLTAIEGFMEARETTLMRAVEVLERYEEERPLLNQGKGVRSGTSSRRSR